MSFELSAEHEDFRRSLREFAEAEIAPYAAQWDRDHHFPVDTVQRMGKLGLFGLTAPEEYGGAGEDGDFTSLCLAIEEIGRVDQSMGDHPRSGRTRPASCRPPGQEARSASAPGGRHDAGRVRPDRG